MTTAAQILLYWRDHDIVALSGALAAITDLKEAKDIITAVAILSESGTYDLFEMIVQNAVIT